MMETAEEGRKPCVSATYSSYTAWRLPSKANSSVAVAHVLSKVLKIEPALFPGNRSHPTVMFHGSLGCLYHPASLALENKKLCFWKDRKVHYADIMIVPVERRQSYKNEVET